jgi:hypothetical protein
VCVLPAAAATPAWKTLRVERHAGPISAVMTVQRRAHGDGFYDFRELRLVVRARGATLVDRLLCSNLRCSPGSHHSLNLQNVWGGSLHEAVVSVYTGGAHCCFDTLVALVDGPDRGRLLDHNWGNAGYRGQWHEGTFDFIGADDRFAYRFTAFAASGLPLQVWAIGASGRFVDVTHTRLDLVRADAGQWWQAYVRERGGKDADVRGVVAAWCADEYRLGAPAACTRELGHALAKGWLRGPDIWPQNRAFVAALERTLAKWRYAR